MLRNAQHHRFYRRAAVSAIAAVSAGLIVPAALTSPAFASGGQAPHVNETPPSANVSISEAGSTLLYPLFQEWATAYHKKYHNITITPQGGGSGSGISEATSGTIDIGASDAYLSPQDLQGHKGLMNIALAISAQQVNYNVRGIPANKHIHLSGKLLSEIYQGKVTMWNAPQIKALNHGLNLPAEQIVTLHRSDASGDTFLFSSYLSAQDPNGWGKSIGYGTSISFPAISNALAEEGNGGMVTGCEKTPGCVAYIGISYLTETNKAHLGEAALRNKAGKFMLPVPKTISNEASAVQKRTPANEALSMIDDAAVNGYPIINYEYAILAPKEADSTTAAAVKAFLYWAVDRKGGSADRFLKIVRFQPLPPAIAVLSQRQISKIKG